MLNFIRWFQCSGLSGFAAVGVAGSIGGMDFGGRFGVGRRCGLGRGLFWGGGRWGIRGIGGVCVSRLGIGKLCVSLRWGW